MKNEQLEFDFVKNKIPDIHNILDDADFGKFVMVNSFVDNLFNKLPHCLGWGLHHNYVAVKRKCKSAWQRLRYGVCDEECWNLYETIAKFALVRLKHFKQMRRYGFPVDMTQQQWEELIDEAIWAFDYIVNNEKYNPIPDDVLSRENSEKSKQQWKLYLENAVTLNERAEKALVNFAKHFQNFWD